MRRNHYTSRNVFGLSWEEFMALVIAFSLDCTIGRDRDAGQYVRFSPKDMANQLMQLGAMEHQIANGNKSNAVYRAMYNTLIEINKALRVLPELSATIPSAVVVYQRGR